MVQQQYFDGTINVDWQWPVRAALPAQYQSLGRLLMQREWPKKFVELQILEPNSALAPFNVLFLGDPSIENWKLQTRRYYAEIVIIIREPDINKEVDLASFAELAAFFKAGAVFDIQHPLQLVPEWFETVVVNLSHNQNLPQAIANASTNARLYYDRRLEEQTTLTFFLQKLVAKLRSPQWAGNIFNLKTRFLGDIKDLKGSDLAELLESNQDYFSYIQESGDASDLLQVATAMKDPFEDVKGREYNYGSPFPPVSTDAGMESPNSGVEEPKTEYPKRGSSKTYSLPSAKGEKSRPTRGMKKMAKPETTEPSTKDDARYLQANIVSDSNKLVEGALQPSQKYKMGVQIGLPKKGFQRAEVEFPSNLIFPDEKEIETTVEIKVKTNLDNETRFTEIKVPRWGDSQTAYFDFATDAIAQEFTADIQAYHQNRLIQEVRFTVKVSSNAAEPGAQHMKLIFCARKSLANLDGRTKFVASMQVTTGKNEEATVQGISENKPLDLFFSGGLKKHLEQMRDKIEDALGEEYKEDELKKQQEDYEKLLHYLAMKGSLVYKDHLRGKITPTGPLQIISNDQSFLPVDFIYSYPPPDIDAKLCPKSKDALKNGKCCGDIKENEAISKLFCPFGFWSCSRIIERHNYQKRSNDSNADYCVVSEPVENRETLQVLNNTLFATSARVDRAGAGITKSMVDTIKKYKVKLSEATDWDNWSVLIGQNRPDSLILVVHIEKDEQFEMNKLELGNEKFLLQTHIGAKVISRDHLDPPPFVVMLGCESTEINNEGFDVASHLMNEGAAIVLSNFTRIKGNHARDIVVNLVKFLEEEGKQVQSFGEIMLKLRRHLLSEGLLAGLILLAQGDADWKIKI